MQKIKKEFSPLVINNNKILKNDKITSKRSDRTYFLLEAMTCRCIVSGQIMREFVVMKATALK